MCQEVHVSDVRLALLDYCEEEEEFEQVDYLLALLENPDEEDQVHAVAHSRRAKQLAAVGDEDAASIHEALAANMARAAG